MTHNQMHKNVRLDCSFYLPVPPAAYCRLIDKTLVLLAVMLVRACVRASDNHNF